MAAYPTIGMQATVRPLVPRRVSVSDGGTVRSVSLGEASAVQIEVRHPYITSTDVATLQSFYANNGATVNTITVRGVTYDVQFAGEYTIETLNATYSTASVTLVGNAQ